MHHFGARAIDVGTNPVHYADTNLVPSIGVMKGKYPNGLEAAMKRAGISSVKLAEVANTSRQQINKLVLGEREMTAAWAERLAPSLQVSPEQLVFPGLRRTRAPLYSWVSAGRLLAPDGVRKGDVKKYILASDLPKGDWIVLTVDGDSMDRIAPDGSYIFVNRADQRLINDKFYVFGTPEGEATFKRYRTGNPPRLQPYSTNPDHETIIPHGELTVLGRVGRVIYDLH